MDNLRACLTDFVLVQNAFERAASTIKASEPLSRYMLATQRQQISLNMVEFSTDAISGEGVPVPTTRRKCRSNSINIPRTSIR